MNEFSFCKQCGTPLTDEAVKQLQLVKQMPEYQEMTKVAEELLELEMQRPTTSPRDEMRVRQADEFRLHVLSLLANDAGMAAPKVDSKPVVHYSREELAATKAEKEERLMELMAKLAAQPQQRQAKARTYALATKPRGMRLAWQCNWKHALHSSPLGCAKPHLGGKWVLMGKGMTQKDDK
jgi:inosine/xanthosine triphosphate pyrophosphatase family protein